MYIHTVPEIASLIRERRRALRLSQAAVAAQIGTSRQWLVAFEGGQPNVELAPVLRALRLLGLTLSVTPALTTPSIAPVAFRPHSPPRRPQGATDRDASSRASGPPAAEFPRSVVAPREDRRGRAPEGSPRSVGDVTIGVRSVIERLRPPRPSDPRTGR